jgi:hypothetical protein
MFQCKVTIDGQKDDIAGSCLVDIKEFHFHRTVQGIDLGASASGRSKNTKFIDLQFAAIFQAASNLLADGTCRTDNANGIIQC